MSAGAVENSLRTGRCEVGSGGATRRERKRRRWRPAPQSLPRMIAKELCNSGRRVGWILVTAGMNPGHHRGPARRVVGRAALSTRGPRAGGPVHTPGHVYRFLLACERNRLVCGARNLENWLRFSRLNRRTEPAGHRSECGKDSGPLGPQEVREAGSVREAGRVDSRFVHFEMIAQRRQGDIDEPQVAVVVLALLGLPAEKAAARREALEVDHDRLRPRQVHVRELEVLNVIAAPVEREDQRRLAARDRRGREHDGPPCLARFCAQHAAAAQVYTAFRARFMDESKQHQTAAWDERIMHTVFTLPW